MSSETVTTHLCSVLDVIAAVTVKLSVFVLVSCCGVHEFVEFRQNRLGTFPENCHFALRFNLSPPPEVWSYELYVHRAPTHGK
jgi:hypothetical protein